jgi:hypothetical protein
VHLEFLFLGTFAYNESELVRKASTSCSQQQVTVDRAHDNLLRRWHIVTPTIRYLERQALKRHLG